MKKRNTGGSSSENELKRRTQKSFIPGALIIE